MTFNQYQNHPFFQNFMLKKNINMYNERDQTCEMQQFIFEHKA